MAIDNAALVPVLDHFLEFAETALTENERSLGVIADLQSKIAQSDRVLLEKVAAAKSAAINHDQVDNVIGQLVQMRLMSPNDSIKVAGKIKSDPNASLSLITKMAEMLVTPAEGRELDEARDVIAEDPDGWGAMAEGKAVRVRA